MGKVAASARPPRMEPLEGRLLLSGEGIISPGPAGPIPAALDVTGQFRWSGYRAAPAADAGATFAENNSSVHNEAVFQFDFPRQPSLVEAPGGLYTVSLAGEETWRQPGEPIVPVRSARLLLPPGERVVSVRVDAGEGIRLAEAVRLLAAPDPQPPDGSPAPDPQPRPAAAAFPAGPAARLTAQRLAGYDLAVVSIFPVAYDPAGGTVTFHPSIRVTVTTAPAPAAGPGPRGGREADRQRVLGMVENDSAAAAYATAAPAGEAVGGVSAGSLLPAAGPFEYVLVTSPALAGAFQRLVDHKRSAGVTATLVTTDWIEQTYRSPWAGEDDAPGRIRQFLADAWAGWQTRYVLLGGDVAHVPARMVHVRNGTYQATVAADVYYACLDGPYNFTDDGKWGQFNDGAGGGEVDMLAELAVGRAPVETPAEVDHFIDKTILYETTPPPDPYAAVLIGEQLTDSPPTWGGDATDFLFAEAFPPAARAVRLYERDGTYSPAAVRDALNASPHFVSHLGHSTSVEDAGLYAADIDALANAHPFIYLSQGCKPGQFEKDDAVGEHLLSAPGGAVAAVLNSHYGWYQPGDATASGTRWALEFWDALFRERVASMGAALADARADRLFSVGAADSDRWQFFVGTLFGDPQTPLNLPAGSAPAGADDAYELAQAAALDVGPEAGVLANDIDPDAAPLPLTAELIDPAAHGELTLRPDGSFRYQPEPTWVGPDGFTYRPFDGQEYGDVTAVALEVLPRPTVVGRYVFYDHSRFDDPAAGGSDDDAIAPDKQPLLPGQTAGFANYTSYVRGLNGVMIDVAHLPAGTLTAADIELRVGNDDHPETWAPLPAEPVVTVRRGAGRAGSDRITLALPDGAVVNRWLEVRLRATPATGLAGDDVFYFGNARADSGNSTTDARVDALDEAAARNHPTFFFNPAGPDNPYDYNRDGKVDGFDQSAARNHPTSFLNCLRLITPAVESPADPAGAEPPDPPPEPGKADPADPAGADGPAATQPQAAAPASPAVAAMPPASGRPAGPPPEPTAPPPLPAPRPRMPAALDVLAAAAPLARPL